MTPMAAPRRTLRRAVAWTALAACAALSIFSFSTAPQQDVSEFEKRLSKINEEIRVLRGRIAEVGKRESELLSQLESITLGKRLVRQELAALGLQQEQLNSELAATRERIAGLKEALDREERSIEKTLVTLYKYGKFDFLQFLLQAQDMSAAFSESRHLSLLARHQQDVIASYLKTVADLRSAETDQEKKKIELTGLIAESGRKRRELEAQEAENKALVQQIRKNRENYEQALEEQKERAHQLQALMDRLASQEIVLPFQFIPFYEKKGKLPWPIAGKIITRFGIEPYLNTRTMNNGIEIAPPKDDIVVHAIHPGKVVYADYFQGYGNLLIIDHGMNYYSLYGHCDEFFVNKGDFVRAEQPIAMAGDLGSLKGLSLYLEIRYKSRPLDPLQWLKRR
jgi:septal ring factor EnvC (AmiA/AmiB activator)